MVFIVSASDFIFWENVVLEVEVKSNLEGRKVFF
jgi:hypothetical protein